MTRRQTLTFKLEWRTAFQVKRWSHPPSPLPPLCLRKKLVTCRSWRPRARWRRWRCRSCTRPCLWPAGPRTLSTPPGRWNYWTSSEYMDSDGGRSQGTSERRSEGRRQLYKSLTLQKNKGGNKRNILNGNCGLSHSKLKVLIEKNTSKLHIL